MRRGSDVNKGLDPLYLIVWPLKLTEPDCWQTVSFINCKVRKCCNIPVNSRKIEKTRNDYRGVNVAPFINNVTAVLAQLVFLALMISQSIKRILFV